MKELIAKCEKSSLGGEFKAWLRGLKPETTIEQVKILASEARFSTECLAWLEDNGDTSGNS